MVVPEHQQPPSAEIRMMLHKLASGEWQATIFTPGEPVRAENFRTKKEAREWAQTQ